MPEKIDFEKIDEFIAWYDSGERVLRDDVLKCIPDSAKDDAKTLMKKLGDGEEFVSGDTLYALAVCRFYDHPQTALHVLRAGIPLPNNRTFEYNFKRIYFDERFCYDARINHNIAHNTLYLECHLEDILDFHHQKIWQGGGRKMPELKPADSSNSWDNAVGVVEG